MISMQEEVFEWNGTNDSREGIKGNETERIEHFRETYRAKLDPTDEDNDGIITTNNITPTEAFEVFQGKVFFTRNEYTLTDSIEQRVETPMQRFTRLRIELESLQSDLMSLSQTEKTDDATIWGTLQREAKKLVDTAASLDGHSGFRVFDRRMGNAGQRLDGLIMKTAVSSSGTNAAATATAATNVAADTSSIDMIALERRVFALEMFLGSATNAIDMEHSNSGVSGCGHWNSLPLADLVTRLEKQFSLLDPAALDNLRTKAAAAKVELESISRTKTSSQSASDMKFIEAVNKIDDLYEQVQKVQAVAEDLPALVLRLKTLENIHQHATSFAVRLQTLEKIAQGAVDDMQSNQEVLGHLQQGLTENLAVIKDSIVKVDQRIEKLNGTKS